MNEAQFYEVQIGNGDYPLSFRSHDIADVYACVVELKSWLPTLLTLNLSEVMETLVAMKNGKLMSTGNAAIKFFVRAGELKGEQK